MSAIACLYNTSKELIPLEQISGMMDSFQKFPSDDVQVWYKNHIFLGCHAQWITPESVGEQLPFYDVDRKLVITSDAIIDNRNELFELLQVDYAKRKTMPDSQLILLAYCKWQEDSPKYLVGDFAYIIWDEKQKKLFGARDFSGSRTLYYSKTDSVAFSTSIEPLFTLPNVNKQLNEQWLAEFLAISGMIDVVDSTITPYKNIFQVPPSHSITVTESTIKLQQYCKLTSEKILKLKNNQEYVEAFKEIFEDAVVSRLRTHQNIGAQLSGGLDSGSIVSFAVKNLKPKTCLHTFSYIPQEDFVDFTPRYLLPNERPLIQSTVQHVGHIKDQYLSFNKRDSYSEINNFLDIMEMPYKFFENSYWLKGMFEAANAEGVGILLNGGRGNLSISWGSALDYYAILLKKFKWLSLANELYGYSQKVGGNRLRRIPIVAKIAYPLLNRLSPQYEKYQTTSIINEELAKRTNVYEKIKSYGFDETGWFSSNNIFEQRKKHFEDLFHWNASNTLSTKLSLRYSLWKRDPTNDLRVIRFCLSLPEGQYVQNGMDRALIRRATKNLLPDDIRLNQRIRGVQGADWIHRMLPHWSQFTNEMQQLVKDPRTQTFINTSVIENALSKVLTGTKPDYILNPDSKLLMRSLIVHRFLKRFN